MGAKPKDIAGQHFGRLRVISYAGSTGKGFALWKCVCDCGGETVVTGSRLRSGKTTSCGCFHRERIRAVLSNANRKWDAGTIKMPEYRAWVSMRFRCNNPTNPDWHNYGGRGISVCKEWDDFGQFFADMGERPGKGYSIDRIDNNGNYEPSNCRWATIEQQSNNRRTNRVVVLDGERMTLAQAARKSGLEPSLVHMRIFYGWPLEMALS